MKGLQFSLVMALVLFTSAVTGQKGEKLKFTTSSNEVSQLLREAIDNYYMANMSKADELVKKAQQKDPDCAFVVLMGPDEMTYQQKLDKIQGMKMSADEQLFMDGFQANLKGESSVNYFNQFFKKYPKDPQLSLWLTFFMSNLDESVACNDKIIKSNKKFGPAYNMMGYKQMQLKNMDEAQKCFDKYLALEPDHANPYDSKGDWFMANGMLKEAGESFDKAAAMGMKVSIKKAAIAKARGKFTEISEQDIQTIKDICIESEESYVDEDFEKLSAVMHNQAIEIYKNNMVNVGKYNIKANLERRYNNGTYSRADIKIDDVIGLGNIAAVIGSANGDFKNNNGKETSYDGNAIFLVDKADDDWKIIVSHYYEDGTFTDEDKTKIKKLCQSFSSLYDFNVKVTEEMLKKQSAYFMPQSIEIYGDHRSNVGLPNMEIRWQYFLGGEFEFALLNPVKISGKGNKAVVCGVACQKFKAKGSDESQEWESAFTSILTKEDGDWKMQVWHWQ
ncbi:nuclear transport factor 2 family protein [Carboxylicivirga linearis]|uniref:DUF4440 domain-containing protein n=1 Tax=Carboxylicivirga linearis TaxID=1628157 RepID=A0ABS5K171_9BACT|nr:nuclear transport factor 2 family protein [Carboxylicivirga linearis]MBS2100874.1 DUF4440 domain-containing protein [Carboxylicivirga linearis]